MFGSLFSVAAGAVTMVGVFLFADKIHIGASYIMFAGITHYPIRISPVHPTINLYDTRIGASFGAIVAFVLLVASFTTIDKYGGSNSNGAYSTSGASPQQGVDMYSVNTASSPTTIGGVPDQMSYEVIHHAIVMTE